MDKEANHKQRVLEPIRHVYVHIPFCARICPYCAFYKELADPRQTDRFCQAIAAELESQARAFTVVPETIFFGGGTPTALASGQLDFLFRTFRERMDLSNLREWTIEANPGSVSARKAEVLRAAGVTRVSLGVQSWDDALLKLLGREHTADQAEASFQLLRAAGMENISIDLMFGLPNQSVGQWVATLQKTISLRPDHISAYCLTYEEDTDFFLRHSRGELRSDNDSDAEFFEIAMSTLESAGYHHYEISNYALPGFDSSHNRGYWRGDDYLGIGPSAFSTIAMSRWQNVCDYRAYADQILSGKSAVHSNEKLTPEMKRAEHIALALRTDTGVSGKVVTIETPQVREFIGLGLLRERKGNLVLTKAGKSLADSVAEELI
jgi:oxygen-independent coproporphyrinogen III oxidase